MKIVPKRHREGHKGYVILRSPTKAPLTKAPRVTLAGTYDKGNAPLKGCIRLLLILNNKLNTATDRQWARLQSKTPPARKRALLTTLSSSLRFESAAEHHTAEQYSKTGRKSSGKI